MAKKSKAEKAADKLAEAAFKKHSAGNPISIFDIEKVLKAGKVVALAGGAAEEVEAAVAAAFAKYKVAA